MRMAKAAKAATARQPAASAKEDMAAVPTKTKGAAAISLKQLAAGLAEGHDLPKRQVEAMLGAFVQSLAEHLQQGSKIRIPGLGIFQVSSRAARTGRNPATGEPIQIKASKKIAFRPAKELKGAI